MRRPVAFSLVLALLVPGCASPGYAERFFAAWGRSEDARRDMQDAVGHRRTRGSQGSIESDESALANQEVSLGGVRPPAAWAPSYLELLEAIRILRKAAASAKPCIAGSDEECSRFQVTHDAGLKSLQRAAALAPGT